MAYRGLLKIKRTPEQLFDVTLQPIIFTVMFTYIFGGAIAGDVQNYLPIIIPGILVQTVITTSIVTGVQLREDMDKGVFDRFRSLPIARIAPLSGALLGGHDAVPHRHHAHVRDGLPDGLPSGRRTRRRDRGVGARHRLRLVAVSGSSRSSASSRAAPRSVQGISMLDAVPAHVPLERVRAGRHACPSGCSGS